MHTSVIVEQLHLLVYNIQCAPWMTVGVVRRPRYPLLRTNGILLAK